MEWISVKDRLPEIKYSTPNISCSDKVLVTDGKHVQVGNRWLCEDREHFLADCREELRAITHWMPLPEPPECE